MKMEIKIRPLSVRSRCCVMSTIAQSSRFQPSLVLPTMVKRTILFHIVLITVIGLGEQDKAAIIHSVFPKVHFRFLFHCVHLQVLMTGSSMCVWSSCCWWVRWKKGGVWCIGKCFFCSICPSIYSFSFFQGWLKVAVGSAEYSRHPSPQQHYPTPLGRSKEVPKQMRYAHSSVSSGV